MGKHRDLIQILIIVIVGMFIPFLGSIVITFNLDITDTNNILKIGSTFLWFLLIFAIELAIVYVYYTLTNRLVNKKMDKYRPK
jgi:hypothetical protein